MAFLNLSTELQEYILVEYGFYYKALVIFGSLAFAIFYIFYYKTNVERPTIYRSIGFLRLCLTIVSYVILYASPISFILLSPEFEVTAMYALVLPMYMLLLLVGLILLGLDFFYYAPSILLKMAGMDIEDPKVKKAYRELQSYFKKNGWNRPTQ